MPNCLATASVDLILSLPTTARGGPPRSQAALLLEGGWRRIKPEHTGFAPVAEQRPVDAPERRQHGGVKTLMFGAAKSISHVPAVRKEVDPSIPKSLSRHSRPEHSILPTTARQRTAIIRGEGDLGLGAVDPVLVH